MPARHATSASLTSLEPISLSQVTAAGQIVCMRGRLRNVDVASCDPAFLGQNSETEQGPECSGAGHNSEANWQCVSGILGIMGLLLLFHMTQLWNT